MTESELEDFVKKEVNKHFPEKLSDKEKMECAKEATLISHESAGSTTDKSNEASMEFIRLEVQVATILFVLTGLFVTAFNQTGSLNLFWIKVVFACGVFSLILSLLMGLLHLKRAEGFWDEITHQKLTRLNGWLKVTRREWTFEEADSFHGGTALNKGLVIRMPIWIWVLQSIFLGIGIIVLFLLFVASLFFQPNIEIITPSATVTSVSSSTPALQPHATL